MKFNKQTLRFAACMAGIFAFLAVCARVTDSAVPTSAEASERPVIVLDAGHGGLDSGAVGKSGVLEKDVNLSNTARIAPPATSPVPEEAGRMNTVAPLYLASCS